MSTPKLRIIHETNPKKYFPALYELADQGFIELVGTHRYSVCKEWLRAWVKDKTSFKVRTSNAIGDFFLRFKIPFIKNETIVIGFAPWDWRILVYRTLAKRNKILYQTSWHDWRLDNTPRQPRPFWFKTWLQKQWHAFVKHPNVTVIAVTPVVAETVKKETGVLAKVIPHAVPEVFFAAGKQRGAREPGKLKLLYVGEISEKKGINELLDILISLNNENISLTVVGNGPLVELVQTSGENIEYVGPIYDRAKLAKVMSEHDVLMLLSQKTQTWEELFGIVIVEAIASGCAVIASNHIGPVGILGEFEGNGLFAQQDLNGILKELNECLKNQSHLIELKSKQGISALYSITTIKKQWQKVIIGQ